MTDTKSEYATLMPDILVRYQAIFFVIVDTFNYRLCLRILSTSIVAWHDARSENRKQ